MQLFSFRISAKHVAGAFLPFLLQSAVWAADPGAVEKVVVKATASFDFDGTTINAADRDAMLAEVGKLKDVTWQTVTATGHTDNVGRAAYNKHLSQRRAAAVKSYLVSNGLAASMVHTRALAAADPLAPNVDEAGRARNRRADVEFQGVRVSSK